MYISSGDLRCIIPSFSTPQFLTDISTKWLSDLKSGFCKSQFYMNRKQCCWSDPNQGIDGDNCLNWVSYGDSETGLWCLCSNLYSFSSLRYHMYSLDFRNFSQGFFSCYSMNPVVLKLWLVYPRNKQSNGNLGIFRHVFGFDYSNEKTSITCISRNLIT